ncbi:DUF4314 domain-containing protein [Streptantibioticus ferralitis]|uniref:DUF4314 domain-containing protein n=1 Tax=Streptantibioticus ferralitis TaxID=236510 RepID=A0ABT5Z1H3_9ACTN|nr:DUF4314 domain-containing protein [Streptantibioticus ferralitis]MDF2257691.1 DUF4314 domain-containing protein [Streptantibioticus ferralitis]
MYQPGDRIVLVHTTDPYTHLRPGEQGTVTAYQPDERLGTRLNINWDSGSTLAMLLDEGDQVHKL